MKKEVQHIWGETEEGYASRVAARAQAEVDAQSSEQGAPERIWLDMNDGYAVIGAEGMGLPEYTRSDICASLVEALEFYADPRKYQGPNCKADDDEETVAGYYRLDVSRDGGDIARAALANLETKESR